MNLIELLFIDILEAGPLAIDDLFGQIANSLSTIDSQYIAIRVLAVGWFSGLTHQQQQHIIGQHTQSVQLHLCDKES